MGHSVKCRLTRCIVVVLICGLGQWVLPQMSYGAAVASLRPQEVASIPEAVITYAYLLSSSPRRFSRWLAQPSRCDPFGSLASFNRSLQAISPDLVKAFAFNYYSFVVQGGQVGQAVGFTPSSVGNPAIPDRGMLFVTTPIAAIGDDAIVIVSSVGPEKTWILAVDKELHAKLIFESWKGPNVEGLGLGSSVGSICQVRVSAPDVFLLTERLAAPVSGGPGPGSPAPAAHRVFRLNVSGGINYRSPLQLVHH